MSDFVKKLNKVIELTSEENLLICKQQQETIKKIARFNSKPPEEPLRDYQILPSPIIETALSYVINEAIEQTKLLLLKFPQHQKPPEYVFVNTISAFMQRLEANQIDLDFYYKWNLDDLNLAKLHIEYTIFIQYMSKLSETLQKNHSFQNFQASINELLHYEGYVLNLETENDVKIEYLRKQELRLIGLQTRSATKELQVLDEEYYQMENDYHDNRIIRAAQLRFNKNLFYAQLDQTKKRETKTSNDILVASKEFERNSEIERYVFTESSKCNYLMIENYKKQITELSEKYENDLAMAEFEITQMKSSINYFEEMWERKRIHFNFMKKECDDYVESIRQRKREGIAKRLGQQWIASARIIIAARKRNAMIVAKKNKLKNKKPIKG